MNILIVVDYYLPGYKGGGPTRTIANLVDWLGDAFRFHILTRDRDLGDDQPYPDITYDEWHPVGKAQVRYLAPDEMSLSGWRHLLNMLDFDLLYLNSFFSSNSVKIMLNRPHPPVIIAPRGEFYPGALALKATKKRLYLHMARLLGLYRGVLWQATTQDEAAIIRAVFPGAHCHVAGNLTPPLPPAMPDALRKTPGTVKAVFISRIARKKNLDYALRLLQRTPHNIQFDIYGPIEDQPYWAECQRLTDQLPDNVQVNYCGAVHPRQIMATFARYHLFLFPTQGENFGHAIWEALASGCLVLTSDQTPWQLEWALPLDQPDRFLAVIDSVVALDDAAFAQKSRYAWEHARTVAEDHETLAANRALFLAANFKGQIR